MSLFKKPKKKMQMRVLNLDDDEEDNSAGKNEESTLAPSVPKAAPKKKPSKENKQKPVLLSFGDEVEDDADSFQVRKSSQSKRLQKQRDREKKEKHSAPPIPPPAPVISDIADYKNDISIKVMQKRPTDLEGIILTGRAALTAGRDDVSGSDDSEDEENGENDHNSHKFKHTDKSVRALLDSGVIPDATVIYAARKKRQQAREIGEYIPIENSNGETGTRTTNSSKREGRLVREDGAGDGSDEDADRIEVCGVAPDQKKERMKLAAQEQEHNGSDIDSDNEEWEAQQIRKAVTHNQIIAAQQETYYGSQQYSIPIMQKQEIELNPFATVPSLVILSDHLRPLAGPAETLTTTQLIESLKSRKKQLDETKAKKEQNLDNINEELVRLEDSRKSRLKLGPKYSAKYTFYQQLRGYLTELIECLDEKMPEICVLETRCLTMMKRRAAFLSERRRADIRDQANEVLTKATTNVSGVKWDTKDEDRSRRAAEREGRRLRRRRMREQEDPTNREPHRDGESSDDEIPQIESSTYDTTREKIVADSAEIFSDTLDEYASMANVLQQMESWRNEEKSAYVEAYVTTCLPKLVAPYLRHKLILWNPITDDSAPDWEGMQWYRGLMLYGLSEEVDRLETEDTLVKDPDICLIPSIVHTVILPKITELVEGTWEPMSTSQTRRLANLARRAATLPGVNSSSGQLQALMSTIVKKIQVALQYDIFIPLVMDNDNKMNNAVNFLRRQSWSAVKLMNNIAMFAGIIADGALAPLAIASLMQKYLLTAIKCSSPAFASDLCERIVQTLPSTWLQRADQGPPLKQLLSAAQQILGICRGNPIHLKPTQKIRNVIKTLESTIAK